MARRPAPDGESRHRKRSRSLLAACVCWIVLALSALVFAAALGVGPPELAHGIPFAWIASAVMLVVALLSRSLRRGVILPALLGSLTAGLSWLMAPDIQTAASTWTASSTPGETQVRVIELNVWDLNPDPSRTLAWVKEQRADIVILAEARERVMDRLAEALPDYPTIITCAARPYCGVVILSRLRGRALPGGGLVQTGATNWSETDPGFALAAAEVYAESAGGDVVIPVIAAHLDRHGVSGVSDQQVAILLSAIATAAPQADTMILAGDFNASPWSPQIRALEQKLPASRITSFSPTWPSGWRMLGFIEPPPVLAIDQIYAGCLWRSRAVSVGPSVGSDHRPLVAELAITPGSACPP